MSPFCGHSAGAVEIGCSSREKIVTRDQRLAANSEDVAANGPQERGRRAEADGIVIASRWAQGVSAPSFRAHAQPERRASCAAPTRQ